MSDIKYLSVKGSTYQFHDESAHNTYASLLATYSYLGAYIGDIPSIVDDLSDRIDQLDANITAKENVFLSRNYLTVERTGTTPVVLKWPKATSTRNNRTLYYSYNKIKWNPMLSNVQNTITLNASNPKVYLKSTITSFFNSSNINYSSINGNLVFIDDKASGYSSKGTFKISGNIMSITYGDNFGSTTSLANKNLSHLFENTNVTDISNLQLPATTLSVSCYESLFKGCTSLTNVPLNLLPATTLADGCYESMFQGCTSLVTGPSLIANNLASSCYKSMFQGCTALTGLYENTLNASIMKNYCYKSMFQGCSSMTNAPTIGATHIATNSMAYMFKDCSNLRTIIYTGTWNAYDSTLNTNPTYPYSSSYGFGGIYGPFYYWVENVWRTGEFINFNNLPFRKISDAGYAYDGIPVSFTNVTSTNS